jgi:MFS family permease
VICSLPAGILADKLATRQIPFLGGLVALLGATVMLFLGQSIGVLIVARLLQGMSAAVVWTVGLAMIRDTVGSKRLGIAIGSIFSFISVGELAAPVLGGIVYKKAGHIGVVYMGFGVLVLDLILRLLIIEKKTAAMYTTEPFEPVEDFQEDLERGTEDGGPEEDSPLLQTGDRKEKDWKIRSDLPSFIKKVPILYCLSDSRLVAAGLVSFVQASVLALFDATIPTEGQSLFHVDSLQAGLLFIPLILPYLLLGSLAGKSVDKYGTKPAATIGFAFLVLPLILLRIPHPGGIAEIVKFSAFVSLCGVGMAFISAPSIVEASEVIEKYHMANKEVFGKEGPYAQLYAIQSLVSLHSS